MGEETICVTQLKYSVSRTWKLTNRKVSTPSRTRLKHIRGHYKNSVSLADKVCCARLWLKGADYIVLSDLR